MRITWEIAMTPTVEQQPAESRLRRWWGRFCAFMQAMETAEYEFYSDRLDYLEERIGRLERLRTLPPAE